MKYDPPQQSSRLILASKADVPFLRVEDLTAGYHGVVALRDVNLFVCKGEMVTLIGANGAGKTSLLRTIAGILKPSTGKIFLGSAPIHGVRPHNIMRQGISWVQEGRAIFKRISVEENLKVGGYPRKDKKAVRSDLEWIFDKFPILQQRRLQSAGTLSGGEQQMLAIARALMNRPELVMLDEPSLGLAPIMIQHIYDIISDLQRLGITVLLVEQNARVALKTATRAYLMEIGRIIAEGPADQLLTDPRVQEAYLGGKWHHST